MLRQWSLVVEVTETSKALRPACDSLTFTSGPNIAWGPVRYQLSVLVPAEAGAGTQGGDEAGLGGDGDAAAGDEAERPHGLALRHEAVLGREVVVPHLHHTFLPLGPHWTWTRLGQEEASNLEGDGLLAAPGRALK